MAEATESKTSTHYGESTVVKLHFSHKLTQEKDKYKDVPQGSTPNNSIARSNIPVQPQLISSLCLNTLRPRYAHGSWPSFTTQPRRNQAAPRPKSKPSGKVLRSAFLPMGSSGHDRATEPTTKGNGLAATPSSGPNARHVRSQVESEPRVPLAPEARHIRRWPYQPCQSVSAQVAITRQDSQVATPLGGPFLCCHVGCEALVGR